MPEKVNPSPDSEPTRATRDLGSPTGRAELNLPLRLGDFELLRELGRGGMGVVYEARQESLGRLVALKVLPSTLGLDPQAVARFSREARAAAALHHANIVQVHAIGEFEGHHYYAMERIEGEPLSAVLQQLRGGAGAASGASAGGASDATTSGRAWFDSVARRVAAVAEGLQAAHEQGIVHRDVKPANLMLSKDGQLCLTDFGLARISREPSVTLSGAFLGTPAYMSPEQVAAGRATVDHRTDIYSLGAVLYEMLTLRRPFEGTTREEVMSAILSKDPRPPRRANSKVPVDLETICLMAMEKDPDRRYSSAAAMAEDLHRYLGRGLVTARRAGVARRAVQRVRRNPLGAALTVAALLLLATTASAVFFRREQRTQTARTAISEAALDLREGRFREGLAVVERALTDAPDVDALHILRARLLVRMARAREAEAEAQALLRRNPDDWRAHLILAGAAGSRLSGTHRPGPDVAEHLRFVEAKAPETADAVFLRALLAEPVAEQIRLLNRALELDPSHVEALLERIDRYRLVKDFPEALADCDRVMSVLPRSAQGRRMRAWVLFGARDVEAAAAEIERAIALDPNDALNYLMRATLHDNASRYEDALADLDRAVGLGPGNPRFLEKRSGIHLDLRDFDRAVEDARLAVAADPDDRASRVALLVALNATGRREDLARAVEETRQQAESWNDVREKARALQATARYEHELGRVGRAVVDIDRAIALDPTDDLGYRVRAALDRRDVLSDGVAADCERAARCPLDLPGDLMARGRWLADFCHAPDRALADLSRAVELAPRWADPRRWRGVLLTAERRWDDALADFNDAIAIAPNWADTYYNRGRLHAARERFETALSDFHAYRRLGSDGTNLRWEEAKALSRLGRLDEALESLRAAERLKPRDEMNLRRRGFLLLWHGRVDEARTAFSRAVEMDPSSARALQTRAYGEAYSGAPCLGIVADLGRALEMAPNDEWIWREGAWVAADVFAKDCPAQWKPRQALDLARRALAFDGTTPEFQETLGFVLYRTGEFEGALRALLEANRLYPQPSASAGFLLASALYKLGRQEEARSQYRVALDRMQATYPLDPRLVRRRREAEAHLGGGGRRR